MRISSLWLLVGVSLALSACAGFTQAPANVENAENGAESNPYNPPQQDNPYTPSSQYSPYTAPNSTYIPSNATVDINAATHTVVYGDTIYNVAKRYKISQDDLRTWNNLTDGSVIKIGQVLKVKNGVAAPVVASTTGNDTPVVKLSPEPTTTAPVATTTVSTDKKVTKSGITWSVPTNGMVLSPYNATTKGVQYGGKAGQPVRAAADGKVVYSGSGLRSYGNLIIVQHDQTYLTAYGNNEALMVKEGDQVKRGQQIARMGKNDAGRVQLHFELRENGTPINPNRFIPQ